MTTTGRFFIAGLWFVGALVGVWISWAPDSLPVSMPYFVVPLALGLLVELALRPALKAGRAAPLTATERAVGVLGASVIAFVLQGVLRAG